MFCPHCGNQVPEGSRFCGKCGAQLSVGPAQQTGAGAQPGDGYTPVSTDVPDDPFGGTPQNSGKKSPVALIVAIVAVVAVVAPVIFGVTRCAGGGTGSAQGVADSVDAAYTTIFEGDFSSDSVTDGVDQLINLMPPEAVEEALEKGGLTRDDLRDELKESLGAIDEYSAYLSMFDLDVEATLGDELDSDELDRINSSLENSGVTSSASEGYHISMTLEMSALGESYDQEMDESGAYAVHLDGGWYLWMNV